MGLYVRDAVLGPFAAWNQFEDYKRFLYADIKGLVTTGIGNLADPIGLALAMPWKIDGRTASQAEIATAWNAVKSTFNAASTPPKADWYAHLTNIRLDDGYIRTLVTQTLKANDAMLAKAYSGYPNWPADAQLAIHSMAYAMGVGRVLPGGLFKNFIAAMNRNPPDFRAAAAASHIDERGNPGVATRNLANKLLLENAGRVAETGGNPDVLWYLREVGSAIIAPIVRASSTKGRAVVTLAAILVGVAVLAMSSGGGRR